MMVPSFDLFVVCWFVCLFVCLLACFLVAVVIIVVVVLVLAAEEYVWTFESVRKYQEAGKIECPMGIAED